MIPEDIPNQIKLDTNLSHDNSSTFSTINEYSKSTDYEIPHKNDTNNYYSLSVADGIRKQPCNPINERIERNDENTVNKNSVVKNSYDSDSNIHSSYVNNTDNSIYSNINAKKDEHTNDTAVDNYEKFLDPENQCSSSKKNEKNETGGKVSTNTKDCSNTPDNNAVENLVLNIEGMIQFTCYNNKCKAIMYIDLNETTTLLKCDNCNKFNCMDCNVRISKYKINSFVLN